MSKGAMKKPTPEAQAFMEKFAKAIEPFLPIWAARRNAQAREKRLKLIIMDKRYGAEFMDAVCDDFSGLMGSQLDEQHPFLKHLFDVKETVLEKLDRAGKLTDSLTTAALEQAIRFDYRLGKNGYAEGKARARDSADELKKRAWKKIHFSSAYHDFGLRLNCDFVGKLGLQQDYQTKGGDAWFKGFLSGVDHVVWELHHPRAKTPLPESYEENP